MATSIVKFCDFLNISNLATRNQREKIKDFIWLANFHVRIYLFFDFVQSTRYIKQKDTSPLQGFST